MRWWVWLAVLVTGCACTPSAASTKPSAESRGPSNAAPANHRGSAAVAATQARSEPMQAKRYTCEITGPVALMIEDVVPSGRDLCIPLVREIGALPNLNGLAAGNFLIDVRITTLPNAREGKCRVSIVVLSGGTPVGEVKSDGTIPPELGDRSVDACLQVLLEGVPRIGQTMKWKVAHMPGVPAAPSSSTP